MPVKWSKPRQWQNCSPIRVIPIRKDCSTVFRCAAKPDQAVIWQRFQAWFPVWSARLPAAPSAIAARWRKTFVRRRYRISGPGTAILRAATQCIHKPNRPQHEGDHMSQDIALELCSLSRSFKLKRGLFRADGEIKAVNDVSLRVYRGETLGLVGESGCGKSTLAKMLLGLLEPSSGNVLIGGREIDPAARKAMAR